MRMLLAAVVFASIMAPAAAAGYTVKLRQAERTAIEMAHTRRVFMALYRREFSYRGKRW